MKDQGSLLERWSKPRTPLRYCLSNCGYRLTYGRGQSVHKPSVSRTYQSRTTQRSTLTLVHNIRTNVPSMPHDGQEIEL